MSIERTFAMLKPGIVQRRLVGEVLSRIEKKGFRIVALKFLMIPTELAESHYGEHRAKAFYPDLIRYITSGPVVAMVLQGEAAIPALRRLCGATKVEDALPGTIRGDLAMHTDMNIIHASDSEASAGREIGLFFGPGEIYDWKDGNDAWI
ncbi:MAG: nucleoside-diphosphate kinase [Spirochaetes bacterium]|nr:nucleoside-diphosphate kinase [Spirochaetota bacterium]